MKNIISKHFIGTYSGHIIRDGCKHTALANKFNRFVWNQLRTESDRVTYRNINQECYYKIKV